MNKLALSALAAVLLSGTAQAEVADVQTVSVVVSYRDLDLTTAAGQAALDRRIQAAVKQICTKPAFIRDLRAMDAWSECRKGAEASAAEQIGAADLATETFAVLF